MLTYCMNVHPGETLEEQTGNIERLAVAVTKRYRALCGLDESYMCGLGLRFGAPAAARFVVSPEAQSLLIDVCASNHLAPFTMNAFPFGAFHGSTVKEDVYRPTWSDPRRISYTADAARSLAILMPSNIVRGSVSTAPLTYKTFGEDPAPAIENFVETLEKIRAIHDNTGKHIILSIEPEPGCFPETTDETIEVVNRLKERSNEALHSYLGVCFDTAHLAVEFEDLADSVRKLREAGIAIGKFQISSALECDDLPAGRTALARYAEGTYLHQTIRRSADGEQEFFGDLPAALGAAPVAGAVLRTHFHVPLFEEGDSTLRTTTRSLRDPSFLSAVKQSGCDQFEVETYTWDVWRERSGFAADIVPGIALELETAAGILCF